MISRISAFSCASRTMFLAVLAALACFPAQAKRKDVVVMNNGDHFTGEVKRLQNGLLFVETDYVSGSIGLDWNQVQSVQSTATYRIVLNNGKRIEGKIEKVFYPVFPPDKHGEQIVAWLKRKQAIAG